MRTRRVKGEEEKEKEERKEGGGEEIKEEATSRGEERQRRNEERIREASVEEITAVCGRQVKGEKDKGGGGRGQ